MAEIPKIVAWQMRATAPPQDHPDPNLLSAFAEKSLAKREQVYLLGHLSVCADCREIMSLATVPPAIADATSKAPANPPWLSWPVLRWGAAVACVLVVGAIITLRQNKNVQPTSSGDVAVVSGKPAQVSSGNPNTLAEGGSNANPSTAALQTPKVSSSLSAKITIQQPNSTRTANQNSNAPASTPIEMADARPVPDFAAMVPGRAKEAFTESPETEADRAMSQPTFAGDTDFTSETGPLGNLTPRWTLNADGTLQRSLDSGRTWQTIPVAKRKIFRALAANALDIWVGGSDGALYHSDDAGQHWMQVQPIVNGEILTDDIIGVEFADTLHGKLTTSTNEIWTTTDAGKTWQEK
jgi:Photosynthesis system II assembly factor YCF48